MNLLPVVCLLPLFSFTLLSLLRRRLPEGAAAVWGVGVAGITALVAAYVGYQFLSSPPVGGAHVQQMWHWFSVGAMSFDFRLRLDALSLVMMGVVTGVGFFIHMFASWYMRGERGYVRFFAYMNLFISAMLFLVLGDNLLVLYFGWEGVGIASYLLIGFWFRDAANGAAARKAFVITRVGDTLMLIGLFVLIQAFGTLNIADIMAAAPQKWAVGDPMATAAALLLLGGAVGKSAQLPLQTWLPDAMAGPTPVSALIHAATMVTAGVYLIARTHVLFELSPFALDLVGIIGTATLLLAGFCALAQSDIKRVLAYSTMSQIGYMFLALGIGAYPVAIFHLMTHAFFKALLFLAAGSIILATHHEQDMFKMGGLARRLPFVFGVYLIGSLALTAIPPTAGFFSKDEILLEAYLSGHTGLWALALFGAFLTAVYTFRMVFLVFFGEAKSEVHPGHGIAHHLPLAVLAVMAVIGGFIHLPLGEILPAKGHEGAEDGNAIIEYLPLIVSLIGIGISAFLYLGDRKLAGAIARGAAPLHALFKNAMGFDWIYRQLFVKPYLGIVHVNRHDNIDVAIGGIPVLLRGLHALLARTENGYLRWYAASLGLGAALIAAAVIA